MTRKTKSFEDKLAELEGQVADLGNAAEGLVAGASAAIVRGTSTVATAAAAEEKRVAAMAEAISELSVSLLAMRQPFPAELRRIVAAFRITYDHKRVAHLAASIAKMSGLSDSIEQTPQLAAAYDELAQLALGQVKTVVCAQRDRDDTLCRSVWDKDRMVDKAYADTFMSAIRALSLSPQTSLAVLDVVSCANRLERICDHARTVSDMVHYSLTGEHFGLHLLEPPNAVADAA